MINRSILLVFFVLFTNISFGQLNRWRASDFKLRQMTYNNVWGNWTDWQSSGVLITVDVDLQRIKIYSAVEQTYDIIEEITKSYDNDGNPIYSVGCLDENGTKCRMVWYHNPKEGSLVIFYFSNLVLMYKVVPLEN